MALEGRSQHLRTTTTLHDHPHELRLFMYNLRPGSALEHAVTTRRITGRGLALGAPGWAIRSPCWHYNGFARLALKSLFVY